jgi:hypothetical protein
MMGQQTMAEQVEGTLRRIILVLAAAALMAMITMATALTAVAAPNSGSAAGQCGLSGASIGNPELPSSGIPGQKVKQNCAPGN